MRLIKFGQAKIPKAGFYVFENPDLIDFIRSLLQQATQRVREEEMEKIKPWLKDMCPVTDNQKHNKAFLKLLNYSLSPTPPLKEKGRRWKTWKKKSEKTE